MRYQVYKLDPMKSHECEQFCELLETDWEVETATPHGAFIIYVLKYVT